MGNGGLSRRRFVQVVMAGSLAGCGREPGRTEQEEAAGRLFDRPLGVQLYTLREVLPEAPRETLRQVAEIGYTEVEVLGFQIVTLAPYLREFSLTPVSGHFEAPLVTGNWEAWPQARRDLPENYDWEAAVALAAQGGLQYMVIAYLMPSERGQDLDYYRRFADQLNTAGQRARNQGLQLCYHNHAFEFEPLQDSTPFDVLMERVDPAAAGLELDVFWASTAGKDPVDLLNRYPGRIPLLHLKDKAEGTPVLYRESDVPREAFREVGNGSVDFAAVLRAAEPAGVRHFFVEQDHTSGDPVESLRQSYQYLRNLEL